MYYIANILSYLVFYRLDLLDFFPFSLKPHCVRFGDLEPSLVEVCNCMQHMEEHFVRSVVLWNLPRGDESDDYEHVFEPVRVTLIRKDVRRGAKS